jgi:hypothetical protein
MKKKAKSANWSANPKWAKPTETSENWPTRAPVFDFYNKFQELLLGYNVTLMVDIETLSTKKNAFPWAIGVVQFEFDDVRGCLQSTNGINNQTYIHPRLLCQFIDDFDMDDKTLKWLDENNTLDWPIYRAFLYSVITTQTETDQVRLQAESEAEKLFLTSIKDLLEKQNEKNLINGSVRVSLVDNIDGILEVLGALVAEQDQKDHSKRYKKHQVLMSKGKDFDFPILENLIFVLSGKPTPWHYRNTDDMRSVMHSLSRLSNVAAVMVQNAEVLGIQDHEPLLIGLLESAFNVLEHKEGAHLANTDCHTQIALLAAVLQVREALHTSINLIYDEGCNKSETSTEFADGSAMLN